MLIKLVIFLPLIGALISGLFCRQVSDRFAQIFNSTLLVISALISLKIFLDIGMGDKLIIVPLFDWITSGNFQSSWSLRVDSLTSIMLIVVTFVSSFVHIYSMGYMSEDKSIPRFMAYLSLFTFFMLSLVTANNFLQLFFGWEGVGLASYLLIGFWFKKPSANAAAIKAFVVNRVGDFGLIIAISLIFVTFGSLNFDTIFLETPNKVSGYFTLFGHQIHTITAICILLFIGAMGKSAQIGLHTWLADAMEGPTPVSALIHAATMVTAGVFLVARCSPIFEYAPIALNMVTLVGAATAIFAATIAITQNDIKKIIAYSTCSQLGYMFFACGVSAYSAGIFHLATHGFFKALLFLGAGSVIYAMHHEQDIRKMGGIYKKIPLTYILMWIGSLALVGFPPFAGFYSKDIILEAAYMSHTPFGRLAFYLGIAAAFLTAFYSFRLLFLVFHGESRASKETLDHAHEPPKVMLIPLIALAIGAVGAGYVGYNILHMVSPEHNFFANSIFTIDNNRILEEAHHTPALIKLMPIIVGVVAIILAYIFYIAKPSIPSKLAKVLKPFYKISFNKWYFDEIYEVVFVKSLKASGLKLWKLFDIRIIDDLGPNGVANSCKAIAARVVKLQSGYIYHYCLAMALGLISFIFYLIFSLKNY
ncbi:MAG: NADH-quinone oxidoreductase subunit L [Proteobacteria bacterium]|nr:NADH-quinone oxidoreductase subunit L [Pseudomonadota bacterium]